MPCHSGVRANEKITEHIAFRTTLAEWLGACLLCATILEHPMSEFDQSPLACRIASRKFSVAA